MIGSGLAGLVTALSLAPQPVTIVTRAALGAETSSAWAQGGVAASMGVTTMQPCMLRIRWRQAMGFAILISSR